MGVPSAEVIKAFQKANTARKIENQLEIISKKLVESEKFPVKIVDVPYSRELEFFLEGYGYKLSRGVSKLGGNGVIETLYVDELKAGESVEPAKGTGLLSDYNVRYLGLHSTVKASNAQEAAWQFLQSALEPDIMKVHVVKTSDIASKTTGAKSFDFLVKRVVEHCI